VAKPLNWRQRVATYCVRALPYSGVLVFFGWLFGWHLAVSALCPADTLASGTIGGGFLWLVASSIFASFGFAFLGILAQIDWSLPTPKRPHLVDVACVRRRRDLVIIGCLSGIALLAAVTGLSFSFCARPQGIFVHATPFDRGKSYAWTDVRKITAYCSRSRGNALFNFDADMNDGQMIPLGDDVIRNYRAVSDALRDVPFIYDNSGMSKCWSSSLRDLLATRPGTHVNAPQ
jgi:hypothetical protein